MAEYSYDNPDIHTGSDPEYTTEGIVTSGHMLEPYTPLGQLKATGKLVPWDPTKSDGSEYAVRMNVYPIDATSQDITTQLIKAGTYNPEIIHWPDGVTDAQKLTCFMGTAISLQIPAD